MAIKAAYFDWNGTLVKDRDDVGLLDAIRYKVQWGRFNPFGERGRARYHSKPFWALWKLKSEVDRLYASLKTGAEPEEVYKKIYDKYNHGVVEGLPIGFVNRVVGVYSEGASKRLDLEVLEQIRKARMESRNLQLVVVGPSAGYGDGIRKTLRHVNYDDVFRKVMANRLEAMNEGKHAKRFGLEILGSEIKKEVLEEDLAMMDIHPAETAYMGDSQADWGCFDFLAEAGGVPIVAPMASRMFKEQTASRYGAKVFIPANAGEVGRVLKG